MFKSAATLVDRAIMQIEGSDTATVNAVYIGRNVNRLRQKDRPSEPKTLDFELVEDYIPKEFLQKDIIYPFYSCSEYMLLLREPMEILNKCH